MPADPGRTLSGSAHRELALFSMLCLLLSLSSCAPAKYDLIYSCKIVDSKPVVSNGEVADADAVLRWNNSIFSEGLYKLVIDGRSDALPQNMMRCAGVLEGYATQAQIFKHLMLQKDQHAFDRDKPIPENWSNWLQENMKYTIQSAEAYQDDEYWQQINLIMTQFKGLMEGYNMKAPEDEHMEPVDFWFIQAECELWDLQYVVDPEKRKTHGRDIDTDHCSALIRVPSDLSDIYFAHDTWSDFRCMHHQLKEYHFPIKKFKASRVLMSTRIGKLFSYDDFYMADTGLLVMETTLSVFNLSLYDRVTTKSLLTWVRAIRAMWTTDNGNDWTAAIMSHNSGTLNNQYLVLDTKKWVRYKPPKANLLWLIEQMPGDFERRDISDILRQKGYWPSFNVPFTERMYNLSGCPEKVKKDGEIYSYYDSPRYKILSRDAPTVESFEEFQYLMLSNNWRDDPFSLDDPGLAIAARYDLRGSTSYGPMKAFGMIDAKCAKLTEACTKLRFHTHPGPTYQNIAVWEFDKSASFRDIRYDGLPQRWEFDWTLFESYTFNACNATASSECLANDLCGWCSGTSVCLPGGKEGPFMDKCPSGWTHNNGKRWLIPVIAASATVGFILIVALIIVVVVRRRKKSVDRDATYETIE